MVMLTISIAVMFTQLLGNEWCQAAVMGWVMVLIFVASRKSKLVGIILILLFPLIKNLFFEASKEIVFAALSPTQFIEAITPVELAVVLAGVAVLVLSAVKKTGEKQ